MDTLFDLDAIPEVTKDKPVKKVTEYYLHVMHKGEWFFLWETHTNGGCEWEHENELTINGGNKKPLRYKTFSGAKRMAHEYADRAEVAVWNA